MQQTDNSLLAQARASLGGKESIALYEKWAATYDKDVGDASQNYVAPVLIAQAALKVNGGGRGLFLDAGCGTGLVGKALALGGATIIDGLDLSPAMLNMATKAGVYRNLTPGDMTQPIGKEDEAYDVVTCCGTFTHGHVGPDPALRELVRITRKNGFIVASILEDIWVSAGFRDEVEKIEAEGLAQVVSIELIDYRKGAGDKARLVVLEKTGSA